MTWKDLKDESTGDLISYIKCKDEPAYKVLAESAFIAFTFRFREKVIDRCRYVGRNLGHETAICDKLADFVFERFYKYPFRFQTVKCNKLDIENCVLLYLYRIAQRCFFDYYHRMQPDEISPYDGTEEIIVELPGLDSLDLEEQQLELAKAEREKVDKVLGSLSEKHRIIYLTYMGYEQKGFKLPRPLLAKLREELELSQNSIRVYKKEAIEAVRKSQHDGKKK